jgi:hypothetical protein
MTIAPLGAIRLQAGFLGWFVDFSVGAVLDRLIDYGMDGVSAKKSQRDRDFTVRGRKLYYTDIICYLAQQDSTIIESPNPAKRTITQAMTTLKTQWVYPQHVPNGWKTMQSLYNAFLMKGVDTGDSKGNRLRRNYASTANTLLLIKRDLATITYNKAQMDRRKAFCVTSAKENGGTVKDLTDAIAKYPLKRMSPEPLYDGFYGKKAQLSPEPSNLSGGDLVFNKACWSVLEKGIKAFQVQVEAERTALETTILKK